MKFYSKKQLMFELINILFFISMITFASHFYPVLADSIPIHWNESGVIDGYGPKIMIFLIPLLQLIIFLLLLFLPTIDKFKENVISSYKNFFGIRITMGLFMTTLFFLTMMNNFYDFNTAKILVVSIGLMFVSLGYFITDIKRNQFAGIRTSPTLRDEYIWEKTHQFSGKLFMAGGTVIFFMSLIFSLSTTFYSMTAIILLSAIISVLYSYTIDIKRL